MTRGEIFKYSACQIKFDRIAGFHCHAIKIKIENPSMNEVKKFTRYRR